MIVVGRVVVDAVRHVGSAHSWPARRPGQLAATGTTAARPAAPDGGVVMIDGGVAHRVALTVAEFPGF